MTLKFYLSDKDLSCFAKKLTLISKVIILRPLNIMVVSLLALSIHQVALANSAQSITMEVESVAAPQTLLTFGHASGQGLPATFESLASVAADALSLEDIDLRRWDIALVYLDLAAVARDETVLANVGYLFSLQVPVLLKMGGDPTLKNKVASIFGISSSSGHALFYRQKNSHIQVYELDGLSASERSVAVEKQLQEWRESSTAIMSRSALNIPGGPEFGALPKLTFNFTRAEPTGEVSMVANIDVVRSAQAGQDRKFIIIKGNATTIKTARNGIVQPTSSRNLWASYLPHAYTASHVVLAEGMAPTLVSFAPPSDGRTDFSYTEAQTRGFTIGGSSGTEFGPGASDKAAFVAKSSFNVNASYQYSNTKTFATTFQDYSLLASQNNLGANWEAPIATRLKSALIDRLTSSGPILTEQRMTPMMRAGTMETYSVWELPGAYNDDVRVRLGGGYKLKVDEWRRERTQIRKIYDDTDEVTHLEEFVLDMSSPYLTREMTVLVRSQQGSGKCLVDTSGTVTMAACNAQEKSHQWGLDSESRYVNRNSGRCLTLSESSGSLSTQACRIDNRQQWQWRADRVHSLYDANWRLFVTGDLPGAKPDGSMAFDNLPVNIFNRFNIPWASYPRAPSQGDVMPNENGPSPAISPQWVTDYKNDIDVRQRWRIEILRDGL